MSTVTLKLNVKEAKNLIEQMPLEDRIKLVKELIKQNWAKRIDIILNNIDERRKKYKIPNKEIAEEIEKARREFYAHSH